MYVNMSIIFTCRVLWTAISRRLPRSTGADLASPRLGLDIGSSSIKAVSVETGRRGARLVRFGIEYLQPQVIVDGALMDQATVVEAIGRLKSALGIGTRDVAIAISGHSVIVKKIQMPPMSREAIAERIPAEAEQHIPFKRDEVDMDYQIVSPKGAPGQLEIIAGRREEGHDRRLPAGHPRRQAADRW